MSGRKAIELVAGPFLTQMQHNIMKKQYKQIDGKLITEKPSKLDNYHETSASLVNKYPTETEYLEYLSSLDKQSLQEFSVYAGVIPTDNQDRLIKLLIAEYKKIKGRKTL